MTDPPIPPSNIRHQTFPHEVLASTGAQELEAALVRYELSRV